MVALIACVVVLEVGLQIGLTLEEKAEQQVGVRRFRREVDDTPLTSTVGAAVTPPASMAESTMSTLSSIKTLGTSAWNSSDSIWDDWSTDYVDNRATSTRVTTTPASRPSSDTVASNIETSQYIRASTTVSDISSPIANSDVSPPPKESGILPPTISNDVPRTTQASAPHSMLDVTNPSVITTQSSDGPNSLAITQRASFNTLSASISASGAFAEDPLSVSYSTVITARLLTTIGGHVYTFISTTTSHFPETTISEQFGPNDPVPTIIVDEQSPDEVELGLTITGLEYFRAMYLPVVVAVLLKLVWSIVFASTKMMEPFYLLSQEGGALAKDSLVADYLISSISLQGLSNLFVGHPVIILATLTYICISALPSLAIQATTIKAIGTCFSETGQTHCHPMWELNITYTRVLQVVLCVTTLLVLAMMILSLRRQSGVFSNPASIATMASLLNNDDFVSEIQRLPQRSSRSFVLHALGRTKFTLAQHRAAGGQIRYGIVQTGTKYHELDDSVLPNAREGVETPSDSDHRSLSRRFFVDVVFLLAMLALLSIIVAYYLVHGDNPFNNFFNRSPVRGLVFTVTASILDGHWKQIEHEVRIMTPYCRLLRGSAKSDSSVLIAQNATPITSLFPALWQRNFFHAAVAFVAVLSDVLIVVIGGVPFSPAQFHIDFVVCTFMSWIILAIMVVMVLALFRWRALNEEMMMPQIPNTLLAVCQLLCNRNNGVCDEMAGTEMMQGGVRDRIIRRSSVRYWAGWIEEEDGSRRWVIEKDKSPKMEATRT